MKRERSYYLQHGGEDQLTHIRNEITSLSPREQQRQRSNIKSARTDAKKLNIGLLSIQCYNTH